eukprot:TRINITY_DN76403_c0_g1_i1.p1 TRINITY_DN76403_c0_g1~~TRINITY_DN76403_c0_g1_i1.p1  ORF type:complete len:457 (-),score=105.45 TRINITY_DN76403_c0_g1_i1:22-1392(-)
MAANKERRLQVVVLGARGLGSSVASQATSALGDSRRKVKLTLECPRDPAGEAFGAKVSPWTTPGKGQGQQLRFGQSGLHCTFPLGPSAPAVVRDARFSESAQLRVRLMSSMVPTAVETSALGAVASWLPTSLTNGVSQELDEVTAQLEAEASIPLANIVSGRVGFAADRALGGWVPLKRVDASAPGAGIEDVPLSIWMQMYVFPDHEAMLPMLKAQLEEEIARGQTAPSAGQPRSTRGYQQQVQASTGSSAAAAAAPRWGPAKSPGGAATKSAGVVSDLIDVSLDDGPELIPATAAPGVPAAPRMGGGLLDLDDGPELIPVAPADSSGGLPRLEVSDPAPCSGSSAFGFIASSSSAAGPPPPSNAPSAFGFIAAGSPGASLDLSALYQNPGQMPAAPTRELPKFEALSSLVTSDLGLGASQKASQTPAPQQPPGQDKTLQGLEKLSLAGLDSSLKF